MPPEVRLRPRRRATAWTVQLQLRGRGREKVWRRVQLESRTVLGYLVRCCAVRRAVGASPWKLAQQERSCRISLQGGLVWPELQVCRWAPRRSESRRPEDRPGLCQQQHGERSKKVLTSLPGLTEPTGLFSLTTQALSSSS